MNNKLMLILAILFIISLSCIFFPIAKENYSATLILQNESDFNTDVSITTSRDSTPGDLSFTISSHSSKTMNISWTGSSTEDTNRIYISAEAIFAHIRYTDYKTVTLSDGGTTTATILVTNTTN